MKKEEVDLLDLGFQALKRAYVKVYENARRNNLKIPVWRNGKIDYIIPEKKIKFFQ